MEVELNAQYQSGINWKVLGVSEGPHAFGNSANAIGGLDPITNIPQDFSNVFTLNARGGQDLQTFIELLNTQGRVHILSSPRISTINNQKAVIKVGNDRFFVTNVSNNTVTGTTASSTQNIELTPFFSGIALDVIPQIDDADNVTLHIHPMISNVTQDKQKFTVNGQDEDLPLAQSSIRESDSVIHAKSGQIIVIGGLMHNQTNSDEASTPGTENWGFVSGLFKSAHKTAHKFELVILLRPIVTNANYNWNRALKEETQRYNSMKGDFRYDIVKADKKK
jgi:MSHA biogenesis protein MshL